MSDTERIAYHFTVLRAVPHVYTGAFVNIGVVLFARTAEFLGMRAITDEGVLRDLTPDIDIALLIRYLDNYNAICRGDPAGGPIALTSRSERFHWMSAPRSDVLQPSPVHEGVAGDPAAALEQLAADYLQFA